jgi:hypothetical protein
MSISVYLGEDQLLPDSSGIGFYGDDGFGAPILIGGYNGRTFVTNSDGTIEGFECNNIKKISSSGLIYGQTGSGITLTSLPNTLATFNIRFEYPSSVRTLSGKLYIFDGSLSGTVPNINNDPSGLTCYCAEIRHSSEIQDDIGIGDSNWTDTHGSTFLNLISSPGTSGLRPNGSLTLDTRHDWYVAISATPYEFGDKQFAMYFETEFL